jgi:hypothetical protein
MAVVDRGVYLRNCVTGLLSNFSGQRIGSGNIRTLANEITELVLEVDSHWNRQRCREDLMNVPGMEKDIPQ